MAYHDLSECSLTPEERVAEAQRIVNMLNTEQMTQREQDFIGQMDGASFCSVKQLFYLRDIKDKYL